jgi:hypothetical protein
MEPGSTDVTAGSAAVCDRAPSAPTGARIHRRTPISATESVERLMWRYRLGIGASHDTIGWKSPGS